MEVLVIGKEKVSYISKRTNNPVNGYKIFYEYPIPDGRGIGKRAGEQYISNDKGDNIELGMTIEFYYNQFGTVAEIKIL